MKNKQGIILGGIFLISAVNFIYILWFYKNYKYLPPPFFYDKEDTFMDFYNVLYWSCHDGIYTEWKSVYPPLNFLFAKVYQSLFMESIPAIWSGFEIRESQKWGIIPLLMMYTASMIMAVRICFRGIINTRKQLILAIIFLISPAFLFALERGNLIILCLPLLGWYIFSKNQLDRSFAFAVLVNLKPYFIVIYILQILNIKSRKYNNHFLFLAPLFGAVIFIISGLLLNQEFYLMPENLLGFANKNTLFSPPEVLTFSSSITAFSYLRGLITEFSIPPIIGYLTKIIIYAYLIKAITLIYHKKLRFEYLAIFSIIFLTNYSVSTGGYGALYYIPAIALWIKEKDWALLAAIAIGMIGVWDLIPIYYYEVSNINSYLSNEIVENNLYITIGSIIRPISNLAILILFIKNLKNKELNG